MIQQSGRLLHSVSVHHRCKPELRYHRGGGLPARLVDDCVLLAACGHRPAAMASRLMDWLTELHVPNHRYFCGRGSGDISSPPSQNCAFRSRAARDTTETFWASRASLPTCHPQRSCHDFPTPDQTARRGHRSPTADEPGRTRGPFRPIGRPRRRGLALPAPSIDPRWLQERRGDLPGEPQLRQPVRVVGEGREGAGRRPAPGDHRPEAADRSGRHGLRMPAAERCEPHLTSAGLLLRRPRPRHRQQRVRQQALHDRRLHRADGHDLSGTGSLRTQRSPERQR